MADRELANAPIHITVVGGKQDPHRRRAAAFACTHSTCSNPVYEPGAIAATVSAALYQ